MRLLLFLSLALFTFQASADGTQGTKVPVVISIPEEQLNAMSPDERILIEVMKKAFEENLWKWESMNTDMPETVFTSGPTVIRLSDLFSHPTSRELHELSLGADGKPRQLTLEEIDKVREEGILVIPSRKYPGQNHTWKLAFWLQTGRKNIEITADEGVANGLRKFVVWIPARLGASSSFSAGHGLLNIWKGLRDSVSQVVGLKEQRPKYSDAQINEILEREALAYTQSTSTVTDYRLYDEELMEKALPILENIVSAMEREWAGVQSSFIQKEITHLSAQGLTPDQIEEKVVENLNLFRRSVFYGNLLNSIQLESLSPGLGQLLVNRHKATQMMIELEAQVAADVRAFEAKTREELVARYPLRGRIPEWIDQQVESAKSNFLTTTQMSRYEQLIERMRGERLADEAHILEKNLEFYRLHSQSLGKELVREKVAARKYDVQYRIFLARNWIKRVEERNGVKVHVADRYTTASTSSDRWFWRLRLARQRTWQLMKEVNYLLGIENLLNGPVGFQSLVRKESFRPFKMVDPQTGEIVVDESRKVSTLRERHTQIWNFVDRKLSEFEKAPETGFISKDAVRGVHTFFRYSQGTVCTVGLWGCQPVATLANAALSGTVMAATTLGSPLIYAFLLGWDALVYDSKHPRHSSPLFPVLSDLLIRGAGGAAVFAASVVAPLPLTGVGLYQMGMAKIKQTAHNLYDKFMIRKLIKPFAKVPDADNKFVRRVQGPDLAANYTYQIHPELAVIALQATLERVEVEYSYQERVSALSQPMEDARWFVRKIFGKFLDKGSALSQTVAADIEEPSAQLRKELDEKHQERLKAMPDLNFNLHGKSIRQTESDLDKTLSAGVTVVTKFYNERLRPYVEKNEARFWNRYSITQGDFMSLTRHYLQETFGSQFTTPLEGVDEGFKVDVHVRPDLGVLESIFDGTGIQVDDEQMIVPDSQKVSAVNLPVAPLGSVLNELREPACSLFWKKQR